MKIRRIQKQIELLRKENVALKEQKKFSDKNCFSSKTQKLSSKKHDFYSYESDKDDFDGSSVSGLLSKDNVTDA